MAKTSKTQEFTFDLAFNRLDQILGAMETDDIPLEKAFELYETGIGVIGQCSKKLNDIEAKVKILNG